MEQVVESVCELYCNVGNEAHTVHHHRHNSLTSLHLTILEELL